MPLTKSDIPNLLEAGLKGIFFEAYNSALATQWQMVASRVPSTKDTEAYAWLGALPKMREFIDERQLKALVESNYTLKNKTYEATVGVDRAAIEDDQYGQIKLRVQQMGFEAARFIEELVFTALQGGAAALCYDGQYFFDTDHVTGDSGTQSNMGTTALSAATLTTGITAMAKFKDDKGKPMGIRANVLVVPPDLWTTALELTGSSVIPVKVGDGTAGSGATAATGYQNVISTMGITPIMSPYLTDTNNWYLLDTTKPIKPLIYQERVAVEFAALEANSENGFMRDQYAYGIRQRGAAGYGMWQYAYGGIVSG